MEGDNAQNPTMSDIANSANYFKSGIEPVILSTALSSAGPIASAVTVPAANSVRPASEIIAWTIPVASHCPFRISSSANECAPIVVGGLRKPEYKEANSWCCRIGQATSSEFVNSFYINVRFQNDLSPLFQ